jgi:hypothetical protein
MEKSKVKYKTKLKIIVKDKKNKVIKNVNVQYAGCKV